MTTLSSPRCSLRPQGEGIRGMGAASSAPHPLHTLTGPRLSVHPAPSSAWTLPHTAVIRAGSARSPGSASPRQAPIALTRSYLRWRSPACTRPYRPHSPRARRSCTCKISAPNTLSFYHHVLWTWYVSTDAQLPPASLARCVNSASMHRARLVAPGNAPRCQWRRVHHARVPGLADSTPHARVLRGHVTSEEAPRWIESLSPCARNRAPVHAELAVRPRLCHIVRRQHLSWELPALAFRIRARVHIRMTTRVQVLAFLPALLSGGRPFQRRRLEQSRRAPRTHPRMPRAASVRAGPFSAAISCLSDVRVEWARRHSDSATAADLFQIPAPLLGLEHLRGARFRT
ncbi:hypothetical protein DFH08DRAFT_343630 [Mycena albidolilacea]|uniref:Uncharacterized protein n=1 Tax=Mycena albidolilacea TaxID=1033008 RepID=A0AAD6ZJ98_9AGAR|nr:hypothetical protein DFH08DRAFT_343630 [Mycena albidolilacea]